MFGLMLNWTFKAVYIIQNTSVEEHYITLWLFQTSKSFLKISSVSFLHSSASRVRSLHMTTKPWLLANWFAIWRCLKSEAILSWLWWLWWLWWRASNICKSYSLTFMLSDAMTSWLTQAQTVWKFTSHRVERPPATPPNEALQQLRFCADQALPLRLIHRHRGRHVVVMVLIHDLS